MRKLATENLLCFCVLLFGPVAARAADQPKTMDEVMERITANESALVNRMKQYQPLVETYIQDLRQDKDLGPVPGGDKYFLGRADFTKGATLVSLSDTSSKGKKFFGAIGNFFSFALEYLPEGFLQMIFIDTNGFDKQHYRFDYVRREFLGEVRCLVFDITPLPKSGKGRFLGRIWVEDQDFNVVRINGGYRGGSRSTFYFHFDSWRTNVQPGLWIPSFIYSHESDVRTLTRRVQFKAQTRLWGYNLGHAAQEQELSKILVETPVNDETQTANDLTPLQAQRSWDREGEVNVVDRFQRIGLIAPRGDVDKVCETVVNNLQVTNNLDIQPEVRCSVLMTSTLESFTLGHTIVLSRGLIDVLPDEPSLATMIAHELGHVILGHRMDPEYAFFDRLLVDDKRTFRHFIFARDPIEEQAASQKAIEIIRNSPYKDQLGTTGLFLQALESRARDIPNLISPHLGNRVPVPAELRSAASVDTKKNPQAIAALPIGGRVKLDPWNDKLEMIKSKPVGIVAEREKMPFEITPFMPYLTRYGSDTAKPASAMTSEAKPDSPKQPQ